MSATPIISDSTTALRRLGRDRDPVAWAWLVERHGPRMLRVAGAITRCESLADDAVQQAFLVLGERARRFRGGGDDPERRAEAWLRRLAASCALQLLRRERRQRRAVLAAGARANPVADPLPCDLVDLLHEELDHLPRHLRDAVNLHHLAELDYPDLARELGVTPGTARIRVHRGLKRLRERLERRLGQTGTASALALLAAGRASAEESVDVAARLACMKTLPVTELRPASDMLRSCGYNWTRSAFLRIALAALVVAAAGLAICLLHRPTPAAGLIRTTEGTFQIPVRVAPGHPLLIIVDPRSDELLAMLAPTAQRLGVALAAPTCRDQGRIMSADPIVRQIRILVALAQQRGLAPRYPVLFGFSSSADLACSVAWTPAGGFRRLVLAGPVHADLPADRRIAGLSILLVHGAADALAPHQRWAGVQQRYAAAGARVETLVVPDAGHLDLVQGQAHRFLEWVAKDAASNSP